VRLKSFSVTNYRSIKAANKIAIGDRTTLVGPNNEGKSNILAALRTCIELVRVHARARNRILAGRLYSEHYNWDRDFPIDLQSRRGSKETSFRLDFELTAEEITEFRQEIKSAIDGTLPIQLVIGAEHQPQFKVLKQGRGAPALASKAEKVAAFIGERFDIVYVPAIRSEQQTVDIIEKMLAEHLRGLEKDPAYQQALADIDRIQQPLLQALGREVEHHMKQFLPDLQGVQVTIQKDARSRALRQTCTVTIDDGSPTLLAQKGDGIKSLAAISLMRVAATGDGRSCLLALEEPESHLHPAAARALQDAVADLAQAQQVVVTTHSPLFVERSNVSSNILISNSKATAAKSLKEVRDALGVIAADNLSHASAVLVVEGYSDMQSLTALLRHYSPILRAALRHHELTIVYLGGSSNLSYQLSVLQVALCKVHAFMDYDDAGRSAITGALDKGFLKASEFTYCRLHQMRNSQIEDLIDPAIYAAEVQRRYNVDFGGARRGNWLERMRGAFAAAGSDFDLFDGEVKALVATAVENNPGAAIPDHNRAVLNALITKLEQMLAKPAP